MKLFFRAILSLSVSLFGLIWLLLFLDYSMEASFLGALIAYCYLMIHLYLSEIHREILSKHSKINQEVKGEED